MPYEVFISHSSIDKDAAGAVCGALESQGFKCWIAPRDIVGGTDWSASIVAALEECPAVVLILSEHANASEQVRREVQRSFEKHKAVVPFRIDDVVPTASMEYYLAPVHWINATGGDIDAKLPLVVDSLSGQIRTDSAGNAAPTLSAVPQTAAPASDYAAGAVDFGPSGNLPAVSSAYIGRRDELDRWEALLRGGTTQF